MKSGGDYLQRSGAALDGAAIGALRVKHCGSNVALGTLVAIEVSADGKAFRLTPRFECSNRLITTIANAVQEEWPLKMVRAKYDSSCVYVCDVSQLAGLSKRQWLPYAKNETTDSERKSAAGPSKLQRASSADGGRRNSQSGDKPRKVAIVGVEGSGKTVMLAAMGDFYERPNADGYFLTPKNFTTATYVHRLMARLRAGEWPVATSDDVFLGLDWEVRRRVEGMRPQTLRTLSFLDFAGEVYRAAFVRGEDGSKDADDPIRKLRRFISEADDVVVLVNLSDVIVNGPSDPRAEEASWVTKSILDFALPPDDEFAERKVRAAIVLSQADSYQATIDECGGPVETLRKYLPHVAYNYDWLDVFAVSAVGDTVLDDMGHPIPKPDLSASGLETLFGWLMKR